MSSPYSWTFTTAGSQCPCSHLVPSTAQPSVASSGDTSAVNLGVQFTPSVNGWITGIRFYKGAGNTGTHIGSLWTTGGTLLGQVTFTNESASGWQEADFSSPIAVTAGTTYVASYFAPNGDYSYNCGVLCQRRRHERAAHSAAVLSGQPRQRRVQLRRLSGVPQQHLQRDQLLGGRGIHRTLGTRMPRTGQDRTGPLGVPGREA